MKMRLIVLGLIFLLSLNLVVAFSWNDLLPAQVSGEQISSSSPVSSCKQNQCTMYEGGSVSWNGHSITLDFIGYSTTRFTIDEIATNALAEGDSQVIGDVKLTVLEIVSQQYTEGLRYAKIKLELITIPSGQCINNSDCPPEIEKYCDGEKAYTYTQNYLCSNGVCVKGSGGASYMNCSASGKICVDGVCVEESNGECIDTDGGLNYYLQGTITSYNESAGGMVSYTDSCAWSNYLKEWYCNGTRETVKTYDCVNEGKVCIDGACVEELNGECTDTDGGLNYYEKGIVTAYNKSLGQIISSEDFCSNFIYLFEYSCNLSESTIQVYNCDLEYKDCIDSACVERSGGSGGGGSFVNRIRSWFGNLFG